jgi:hypothetical protein
VAVAPKSVVDLLSEQPPEALTAMLETARAEHKTAQGEVERKRAEVQLIEEALAKARRRAGGGRLTREQVYEAVSQAEVPVTLEEVHAILADQGATATPNSVREHLRRLVEKNGTLVRHDDGRYAPVFVKTADEDIPF